MAYFLEPPFYGGPEQIYFDINISMPIDQVKTGIRVPPEEIQLPIRITTRQTCVPDIMFFQNYFCGVSKPALALLQEFAPYDVEGLPIEIVDRQNIRIPGEYFYLNVLAFRNSIILDETNCKSENRYSIDGKPYTFRNVSYRKLKMNKLQIQDVHIWHEQFIGFGLSSQYLLFASDALIKTAKIRSLSGFDRAIVLEEV